MKKDKIVDNFYRFVPYEVKRLAYFIAKPKAYLSLQRNRKGGLKPFDEKRCIFIHIPKTGGISVANAIFGKGVGWHLTLRPYQKMYSRSEFKSYFKFAFVRNPWDRALSAYLYLKSGGLEVCDKEWSKKNLIKYEDFNQFVIGWLTKESSLSQIHFYPQYRFVSLAHNSHVDVDFVGRYENLQEDFEYVCKKLGIKAVLEHANATKHRSHKDYRDYYTDQAREIVAEVYSEDIEIFGYKYDG